MFFLKYADNEFPEKIAIPNGITIGGRGPFLKIRESTISRRHVVITRKESNVTLKLTNKSPIYIKRNEKTETLKQEEESVLENGDVVLFQPNSSVMFKFVDRDDAPDEKAAENINEVHVNKHINKGIEGGAVTTPVKRKLPSWMINLADDTPSTSKISKARKTDTSMCKKSNVSEDNTFGSLKENINTTETLKENINKTEQLKERTQSPPQQSKDSIQNSTEALYENNSSNTEENLKSLSLDRNIEKPDTSVHQSNNSHEQDILSPARQSNAHKFESEKVKERCPYGAKCYRKNPVHLEEFDHTEDKPECEYGTSCYRTNPEHTRNYEHTQAIDTSNTNTKRQSTRKKKQAKSNEDELESENEYDLEDSFIDDDVSLDNNDQDDTDDDDFVPSENDDDNDEDDNDEDDNDDLLAEAKDFIDNPKMQK